MTNHIDDGWLWITNGTDYLKVFCEHIVWNEVYKPDVEHYEGGVNFGWDLSKYYVIVKAMGVWLNTATKKDNFSSYVKTWQQANTLKIEISKDGTNKVPLDGTNTTFPMLIVEGLKEIEKMPGTQQVYRIGDITFEQNGTPS